MAMLKIEGLSDSISIEMAKLIKAQDYDKSVLALTIEVIDYNVSNYSAWYLRRRVLKALNLVDITELELAKQYIEKDPKSYQAWYHRRWTMAHLDRDLKLVVEELESVAQVIDTDSKHYNAWEYRQWLVNEYKLNVEEEKNWVDSLIIQDSLNNAAWNYREWLTTTFMPIKTYQALNEELSYIMRWASRYPENESVWAYFHGLFDDPLCGGRVGRPFSAVPEEIMKTLAAVKESNYAKEALAKILWSKGNLAEAREIYGNLSQDEISSLRKYYALRAAQLDKLLRGPDP